MRKESDTIYRLMVLIFKIQDLFSKPGDKLLHFGIQKGQTVVDYGCGPGRYLKKASELAGESGVVIAADIHKIALENVEKRIREQGLKNVVPVLLKPDSAQIEGSSADVVYALDMFHQVENPAAFLREIHRIIRSSGFLYLEDGHQPRSTTLSKIGQSNLWQVDHESEAFLRLRPLSK